MKSFIHAAVLVILANIYYALTDIFIWQRVFETNKLFSYGAMGYHTGWLNSLLGMIVLGSVSLWFTGEHKWAIWYAVSLYFTALGGTSDILYYWLDGRALPRGLSWGEGASLWLYKPVTDISLIASSVTWISLVIFSAVILINFDKITPAVLKMVNSFSIRFQRTEK